MSFDSVIPANQASGAFRRYDFESFDAPAVVADREPAPAPETVAEAAGTPDFAVPEAEPPAETPPSDPLEIAPGIRLPTADDIEAMHREAFKQGYDAGYEEGSARGRIEASELHQLLGQFDQALSDLDQAVANEILALALEVARLVVRDTIAIRPEMVLEVVREALGQTPQQHAQLHIHPEDAALVRQYLGEQIAHTGHRIVEDASIERGGCRIDSGGAQLDATVATRWRRVVENLSPAHRWTDEADQRG